MKAIEFKSRIKNNMILIPSKIQSQLNIKLEKQIRVIVLIEDSDLNDDVIFQQSAQSHFLNGYSVSDSIYDNA